MFPGGGRQAAVNGPPERGYDAAMSEPRSRPRPEPLELELDLDLPGAPTSSPKPSPASRAEPSTTSARAPAAEPRSSRPGVYSSVKPPDSDRPKSSSSQPISATASPSPARSSQPSSSRPNSPSKPSSTSKPIPDSLAPAEDDDDNQNDSFSIELDDEPRLSAPSRPSAPSRTSPSARSSDDDDDEIQIGGTPIDLGESPSSRRSPAAKPRIASTKGPPSVRRIHLHRHSKETRPTDMGATIAAVVMVLILTVATPFIHPAGVALMQGWLGKSAYIPYVVFAAGLIAAWVVTISRAVHHASTPLHIAAVALIVHMIFMALIVAAVVSGSTTPRAFLRLMPTAAPIVSAIVALGVTIRAGARAIDELRASDRRFGFAALLIALTLAGAAITVRTARYDLPLPRIGEPLTFTAW